MNRRAYSVSRRPRLVTVTDGGRAATVMIGPVRGPEHLTLIHQRAFYHVPISAIAASRADVAFIAFYEPASRFDAKTGVIREFAPVIRVSSVRRRDLPGLTWPGRGTEDTPYYRFDLGPLCSLLTPIANPDRLRVVFRFPDVDRFLRAATIRELGRNVVEDASPSSEPQARGGVRFGRRNRSA
jgi:hypothetical protein